MDTEARITRFIESWSDDETGVKEGFSLLYANLSRLEGVSFDFVEREGVTYSLRGVHSNQGERPLFVMVDVIDAKPRWLSVCFYADMSDDPEMMGDVVPGGLLGSDGRCFDMDEFSEELLGYLTSRIDTAWKKAAAAG